MLGRKDAVATIATLDTYVFWLIGHLTEDSVAVTRNIGDAEIDYDVVMGDEDHVDSVRLKILGQAAVATIQQDQELKRSGTNALGADAP